MLTTAFRPGAPNWLDLASPDTSTSAAFYGGLFGWTSASGPGAARHSLFRQDGRTVAALGPVTSAGDRAAWTVHFRALDSDRTAALVRAAGGAVRFGPFDVLTSGRTTGCTDPTGADFAVWQPHDVRGLDTVTEPGSLCWTECFSIDAEAAKTFYRAVFGWQEQDVPLGLDLYTVLTPPGGGRRTRTAGSARSRPRTPPPASPRTGSPPSRCPTSTPPSSPPNGSAPPSGSPPRTCTASAAWPDSSTRTARPSPSSPAPRPADDANRPSRV